MDSFSLLEQARRNHPSYGDEDLMAIIASELIELLDLELPIDPAIVASYQGIARIETAKLDWAGCLIPDGGDVVIRVRRTDSPGRRRFTTFHEISHTFLPGYRDQPQYRCTPLAKQSQRDPAEVLCDIGASELLLPARLLRPVVDDSTFDLDSVLEVAELCDASVEAAARRFVSLWPEPAAFIRMEEMTKPAEPTGDPKLRVSASVAPSDWPYMPRYKSVSDNHVLNDCLQGAQVDCVDSLDELMIGRADPVELHARAFPFTDSDGGLRNRVLVIARRSR